MGSSIWKLFKSFEHKSEYYFKTINIIINAFSLFSKLTTQKRILGVKDFKTKNKDTKKVWVDGLIEILGTN